MKTDKLPTLAILLLGHITKYYSCIKSLSAPVDVVNEDKALSAYPVVVVPGYQLVDKPLVETLHRN